MSDKKQIILVWVILCVILALSVFFWYVTNHWWAFFIIPVSLYIIEYGCEVRKYKTWLPQCIGWLTFFINKFKKKESTVVVDTNTDKLRLSISTVLAKVLFIDCCIEQNYSALGEGTPEQLADCFQDLLSQYYQVCKNKDIDEEQTLRKKIAILELHLNTVSVNCAILKDRFSNSAIKGLKNYYPNYKYTKESIASDLKAIGVAEIKKRIEYDQLSEQLNKKYADRNKGGGNQKKQTVLDGFKSLESKVMEFNAMDKVTYNLSTMTVLQYALLENKYKAHIENLKEQQRKMKR